ncbi:N-acyl-D-amino-acid deacylase family protein [Chitinasiproducens palmae]|uniref:N-acyl-D-amino-acid deacylase n=1 Tax=Chitinasiproducens palmae TaxID=1770053 RepID=A0A1H2PKS7_9BURK|nr:D-aminoacylase [Chitinasiproducens palmae]SDV46565.1 N-acyl-D-amino-acid deacylase [Chitinasiproducens palmae]
MHYDTLIRNALLLDGSGAPGAIGDLGIIGERIAFIGRAGADDTAADVIDATGLALAPGFIDAHTHDDTIVIRDPAMLPKLSQGVTTVIVGNCGISAAPVTLRGEPPDPMNLLGPAAAFCFPSFADYRAAVDAAVPALNVAALVGHTALRNNVMPALDRTATDAEIAAMRTQLRESLDAGALGLSTGLAYANAHQATTDEVVALAGELDRVGGLYATHLRSEFEPVLEAIEEACEIGQRASAPVIVSHLKCAGAGNWGRSPQLLGALEQAGRYQAVGCDCYPYAASSSTLDMKQVTSDFPITITWSTPHPEMGGRQLADVAAEWQVSLHEAAQRLQPAGAVYYGMSEDDVRRILSHPLTMVGSDGLPDDPLPHPRLWGAFARVLGHYSRDVGLFPLHEAVHKMTGLPARRFGLAGRGVLAAGNWADLVMFHPEHIADRARFDDPVQPAAGIHGVWVNGVPAYRDGVPLARNGRFLAREHDLRDGFAAASPPRPTQSQSN